MKKVIMIIATVGISIAVGIFGFYCGYIRGYDNGYGSGRRRSSERSSNSSSYYNGSSNYNDDEYSSYTSAASSSYEVVDTFLDVKETGDLKYVAYIRVKNTGNINLYFGDTIFDFEDDNGHLLMSRDDLNICGYCCPIIVEPGEEGYIYSCGSIDNGVSIANGFNLVPNIKVKETNMHNTYCSISDESHTRSNTNTLVLKGRVTNDSSSLIHDINVIALVKNGEGKVIGIGSSTRIYDVEAGETRSFDIYLHLSFPEWLENEAAYYETIAYDYIESWEFR